MVSPRADRRLAGVASVLAAAVLALAGAARTQTLNVAALVKGTNGSDVLRGGPRGDILEGLGGNDRLYGRAGPDRLYGGDGDDRLFGGPGADKLAGGPGADRFSCGRGRDVVYTTTAGGVSRDCEIVHRTATPAPGLLGGTYRGDSVGFQFAAPARTVSHLSIDFNGQCPAGTAARIQIARSGPFPVQPDGTFAVDEQEVHIKGTIQNGGVSGGTFELQTGSCDTGTVAWTAKRR
jgi:hypothetical protein